MILSDCNTAVINYVLKENNIYDLFDKIITNNGSYDKNGIMHVEGYHDKQHSYKCPKCPWNLCKGSEISKIDLNKYKKVYYVGDGTNDICPTLHLREKDIVCARKDSELDLNIKSNSDRLCNYQSWGNYHELSIILNQPE